MGVGVIVAVAVGSGVAVEVAVAVGAGVLVAVREGKAVGDGVAGGAPQVANKIVITVRSAIFFMINFSLFP
ncbi:MAG: hypothetical protein FVQ83_14025 [Chloroflexi bacterium]|nr:hypothetical protein [Chloroflexota bacterium]